jgi:dCMP deaminase
MTSMTALWVTDMDFAFGTLAAHRARRDKWDQRWMALARHFATFSEDRSRQVGCVVVGEGQTLLSQGWNGFPRGVNGHIDQRHERPEKYEWTKHAEENAIANAARQGTRLMGATMYLPWYPCAGCAGDIVQAGIKELVVIASDPRDDRWGESMERAETILAEGGVIVRTLPGDPPEKING